MHVPLIWMASGSPVDILLVVVERVIAVHTYFSHNFLLVLQRARRQIVITACHLPDLHFRYFRIGFI